MMMVGPDSGTAMLIRIPHRDGCSPGHFLLFNFTVLTMEHSQHKVYAVCGVWKLFVNAKKQK